MGRVMPQDADRAISRGEFDYWGAFQPTLYECGVCDERRRNVERPRRRFRAHLSGKHLNDVIDAMEER